MSTPSQFATAHGALAPINPEVPPDNLAQERQEERINAPRLSAYLNRTLDAIAELDQNDNLKIHNEMVRCVAYYDGRSDGKVRNGEWIDNPAIAGEIIPKDNEYKKQIDKLLMEMCRGRISYEADPVDESSARMREAAAFAQHRIEVNQERIETEPFVQRENQSLLLKTWALRYSFFDRNADSREKSTEVRVLKQLTAAAGLEVCRTCETTASADICPNCGDSERKMVFVPESQNLKIEQNKIPAGRVVTIQPDATMVQLDLNARDIPSSSFVRWRLVLRRCDWEAMFPDTKIPSGDESQEGRERSSSQNQASNSDWSGSSNDVGGDQFEKIEGELVWLDPKVTQRYAFRETETLKGGVSLPAGTKYNDKFSSGSCVARIGKTILDIYPSDKNKCWTMCVYGLREHALHGSGTIALLGPQDTINDENAFIVGHHYQFASGREFLRSGAIDKLPTMNDVGIIENAPNEVGDLAAWAYGRTQPEALSGDVYGFRESMRGSLQDAAGTSSLSMQGAADAKALGTATGVEASRDQAVGRLIPNRKLQAFMGSEWATQVLELERENYSAETFLELAGKANEKGEVQFTQRGVETFFQCDVRNDFIVKPAAGSMIPTTPAQERANATEFGGLAAQLQDPKLISLLAPRYGIDYSVDEWGAAQRSASMRLEEYARVSKIIEGGGYPASPEMVQIVLANVAEWARVNPLMDNHPAYVNFYQDWWQSDEGRNASSLLRLVVQEVRTLHVNKGVVSQAQEQSSVALAAKAPEMAAQEEMANQQKQQQAAEMAQADDEAQAQTIEQATGEQMLKQHDREHEAQTEIDAHAQKAAIDLAAQHAAPNTVEPGDNEK